MKKRYKVIELKYKTKTVFERYDPTLAIKNLQTKTVSYHNTLQQATKKIEKLENMYERGLEADRAFGAPSECYALIPKRKLFIVDTKTGSWYEGYPDDITGDLKATKIKKPTFDFGKWLI